MLRRESQLFPRQESSSYYWKGTVVNIQDCHRRTPMHSLALEDFADCKAYAVIQMLIAEAAELGMQDSLGMTPMHSNVWSCLQMYLKRQSVIALVLRLAIIRNTPLQAVARNSWWVLGSLESPGSRIRLAKALIMSGAMWQPATVWERHLAFLIVYGYLGTFGLSALQAGLIQCNFGAEQVKRENGAALLAFTSGFSSHSVVRALLQRRANPNALPVVGRAEVERYLDRVDYLQIEDK